MDLFFFYTVNALAVSAYFLYSLRQGRSFIWTTLACCSVGWLGYLIVSL